MFLYENSQGQDVYDVVTPSFDKTRIVAFVRSDRTSDMDEIANIVEDYVAEHMPEIKLEVGGFGGVLIGTRDEIINSQMKSLAISLFVVLLMLALVFRSILFSFVGAMPLIATILINFSLLGWSGLFLDVGTAIAAPIAIGVSIDYSIYFFNNIKNSAASGIHAIRYSLGELFPPIVFNTLVQGFGFLALLLSGHQALQSLGVLISLTMFGSALVATVLLPLVMVALHKPALGENVVNNHTTQK
jgi:predicted RND superfamily exporter protein